MRKQSVAGKAKDRHGRRTVDNVRQPCRFQNTVAKYKGNTAAGKPADSWQSRADPINIKNEP